MLWLILIKFSLGYRLSPRPARSLSRRSLAAVGRRLGDAERDAIEEHLSADLISREDLRLRSRIAGELAALRACVWVAAQRVRTPHFDTFAWRFRACSLIHSRRSGVQLAATLAASFARASGDAKAARVLAPMAALTSGSA